MSPAPWDEIDAADHDLRLVVCDMDGTLLDGAGEIPADFWPLLERIGRRGVIFAPASGRQYATLAQMFERAGDPPRTYVAENGALVVHDGEVVSSTTLDRPTVLRVIERVRDAAARFELGLVVSGARGAYIERTDEPFEAQAKAYYVALARVEDLTEVDDEVLKLAIYDAGGAHASVDVLFGDLRESHQLSLSGEHWIDIVADGTNKGHAIRRIQRAAGITPAQTAIFGDYLNDAQMFDVADLSFAMANAHPAIVERARYLAPTNVEHGVLLVIDRLLG